MNNRSSRRTKAKTQLLKLLDDTALSVDFVGAIAGDRQMTPEEQMEFNQLKIRRKHGLYSDILFAICHQYFPAGKARILWEGILEHREFLNIKVGRNLGVLVAAMDYLSNICEEVTNPIIVSEPSMTTLAEVAVKDGLTRLYDHSTFVAKLRDEIRRYERYGNLVSLVMLDVDRFKQYNDNNGHQAGDQVLVEIGELVTAQLRSVDVGARYGGEEFAIILPRTDKDQTFFFAERLRKLAAERFEKYDKLTISLGVATCPQDATTPEDLIRAADKALYESKRQGRNRTTCV